MRDITQGDVDRACRIGRWYGRRTRLHNVDDLDGAALEGLAHAARKWVPGSTPFWHYAVRFIVGACIDDMRRTDHLTRDQRALVGRAADGSEVWVGDFNQPGQLVGSTPAAPLPLDAPVRERKPGDDELTAGGALADPRSDFHVAELRDAVLRALGVLQPRGTLRPALYCLLAVDYCGWPNQHMAKVLGLSEGRVTQLRAEASAHIRAHVADSLQDAA